MWLRRKGNIAHENLTEMGGINKYAGEVISEEKKINSYLIVIAPLCYFYSLNKDLLSHPVSPEDLHLCIKKNKILSVSGGVSLLSFIIYSQCLHIGLNLVLNTQGMSNALISFIIILGLLLAVMKLR